MGYERFITRFYTLLRAYQREKDDLDRRFSESLLVLKRELKRSAVLRIVEPDDEG